MKGDKIMGVLWIIIAVFLCIFLVGKLKNRTTPQQLFHFSSSNITGLAPLSETKNFDVKSIDSIDINVLDESVVLEKTNGSEIIVELYCSPENKPTIATVQRTLKITEQKPKNIISLGRKIVVKIPASFDASDIDVKTASGSIHMSDSNFNNVDCRSASGSINFTNCNFENLDLKSQSGSINLSATKANELDCHSTSGSIHLDGSFDQMDVNAVSGSIHANITNKISGHSSIQSTSGSINLNIPKTTDATINYSVTSGSYSNDITGTKGKIGTDRLGNGSASLNLRSVSGSIRIH